jgi:hypothetical protein
LIYLAYTEINENELRFITARKAVRRLGKFMTKEEAESKLEFLETSEEEKGHWVCVG